MRQIGLLNEKPLHAALKQWYAQPEDQFEVPVDGFVVDIVHGDLLLEIQTRSFASIKSKLVKLTGSHRVCLIYPIAQEKWIVKPAKADSSQLTRRKSPRRGRVEDLFWEMVSFPQLLAHPNFSIEVLLIREEEVMRYDGKRNWRRKGWVTEERRLLEVIDRRLFVSPADWQALLPETLKEPFTTKEVMTALEISISLAQRMVYCLHKAGAIRLIGKRGRARLWHRGGVTPPLP